MARVHYVKKARASKRERKCRTCGKPVVPGDAYKLGEPNMKITTLTYLGLLLILVLAVWDVYVAVHG